MNPDYIRELIVRHVRQDGLSLQESARNVLRNLGGNRQVQMIIRDVIREINKDVAANNAEGEPQVTRRVGEDAPWYTGTETGDKAWPAYEKHLDSGSLSEALPEIDRTSKSIVSRLADPSIPGQKKKGLVVGYVQSGKTANYTAVMAKAADSGYLIFVVLSGMHNNLRRQTQDRLESDLFTDDWYLLTTSHSDFGEAKRGAALMKKRVQTAAIVKKQRQRLEALRDWLRDIPFEVRLKSPVLLIDDEADQATPNTKAENEEISRINQLLREIWQEIPTGTYIGYTATPFANVFMDPNDHQELYPSDFIMSLPRPDTYFGAERLFGKHGSPEESDDGMDVIRYIPDEDLEILRPPSDKEERLDFTASVPSSLKDAIIWFIISTAIRDARGQNNRHSSMLVHTTHYTSPHFSMQNAINDVLKFVRNSIAKQEIQDFERIWHAEHQRAADVATVQMPAWQDILNEIPAVADRCRVVVDNSSSLDRLDYNRVDEDGRELPETVIAVGGGTLSRGLTLEGLVVSYFTRTSNTYDTLLQMGRWFGYRPGYEDLPRLWMPADLRTDFEFLALVESEIRVEINELIDMGMAPRELGVRVRAHPGRLAITASNKLVHAEKANLSFTGKRVQTFILDTSTSRIIDNQEATKSLIGRISEHTADSYGSAEWLFSDIDASDISQFFREYEIHPSQHNLPGEHVAQWIDAVASHTRWNVAIMSRRGDQHGMELGDLDLGLSRNVAAFNRAPLSISKPGEANIKALLSQPDWLADIPASVVPSQTDLTTKDLKVLRQQNADGRGLLIIYVVSRRSVPMRQPKPGKPAARTRMEAEEHPIGVGIVFPGSDVVRDQRDGDYYVVHPDWEIPEGDLEEFPIDDEQDDPFLEGWEWLQQ